MSRLLAAVVAVGSLYACTDSAPKALDGPAAIARGRQLFVRNGCAECHGPEGHGDGRIAQALQPTPRDFRQPQSFRHGYEIENIADTIRDGVVVVPDRRVMPRYDYLAAGDRRALAIFIQSLAVDDKVRGL